MTSRELDELLSYAKSLGRKTKIGFAPAVFGGTYTVIFNRNFHGPRNDIAGPGAYIRELDEHTDDAARIRELIAA